MSGHYLTGDSLTSVPEQNLTGTPKIPFKYVAKTDATVTEIVIIVEKITIITTTIT